MLFLEPHPQHVEVPRLRVKSDLQLLAYTTAHSNAGSLTHWVRPGIKPASSCILVRFASVAPQWELLNKFIHTNICLYSSVREICKQWFIHFVSDIFAIFILEVGFHCFTGRVILSMALLSSGSLISHLGWCLPPPIFPFPIPLRLHNHSAFYPPPYVTSHFLEARVQSHILAVKPFYMLLFFFIGSILSCLIFLHKTFTPALFYFILF